MQKKLDETDIEILKLLQRNAERTKAEIGKELSVAPSAISERIKRLENDGVIVRYETRIDPSALGYGLLAYTFVGEHKPASGFDTGAYLRKVSGVEEVHKIAGEDCFIVKIRACDTEGLGRILDDEINTIESISSVRTTIVLGTVHEDVSLGGVELSIDE